LYHPVTLAREILTAFLIFEGRLLLGVSAGSTQDDFAAAGVDFERRFKLLDESLKTMKRLWNGEGVGAAQLDPWPQMVGGPPVLIGTWGGRWLERAGSHFDGWVAAGSHMTWQAAQALMARFRAAGGRRAVMSMVVADLDADGTAEPDDPIDLRCSPDQARQRLRRLAQIGFDDVALIDSRPTRPEHLEALANLI
jgi:alkanesulfonate monooxygenase SsuD/methylene tetrahydromethanopterin reductase-like flavin-dependent oxidoreductase (luciferase family)